MTSRSTIEDKAPKPPGLLPKNVQSWLLASLALLMIGIMWLTGGKKPPAPARSIPTPPAVQAPFEVNVAKIVELQNRIQQLQREQVLAQNALTQQTRVLTGGSQDSQPLSSSGSASNPPPARPEDSTRGERTTPDSLSPFPSTDPPPLRTRPPPATN